MCDISGGDGNGDEGMCDDNGVVDIGDDGSGNDSDEVGGVPRSLNLTCSTISTVTTNASSSSDNIYGYRFKPELYTRPGSSLVVRVHDLARGFKYNNELTIEVSYIVSN